MCVGGRAGGVKRKDRTEIEKVKSKETAEAPTRERKRKRERERKERILVEDRTSHHGMFKPKPIQPRGM
jgi:hypothetical protein